MEKWDAYHSNFEKIDGKVLIRGEEKHIPNGVYHLVCEIIVKHTDGDYLLMKRDERKSYGGMWEATAGGSALMGETPLQCAIRELREETGIEAVALTKLGTEFSDQTHCGFQTCSGTSTCPFLIFRVTPGSVRSAADRGVGGGAA